MSRILIELAIRLAAEKHIRDVGRSLDIMVDRCREMLADGLDPLTVVANMVHASDHTMSRDHLSKLLAVAVSRLADSGPAETEPPACGSLSCPVHGRPDRRGGGR